jgi:hypothetical protein
MKNKITTNKTEMKNYKSVTVYTGYGENGIENVFNFQSTSLTAATELVEDNQISEMINDEDWNEEFYNEFFGQGRVVDGVGIVNDGEENIMLVIEKGNVWFDKVDSYLEWSDELFQEWNEFLNKNFGNVEVE